MSSQSAAAGRAAVVVAVQIAPSPRRSLASPCLATQPTPCQCSRDRVRKGGSGMTIQGPLLTSWLTKPGLTRAPPPPSECMSAGANQALEDGPLLASWLTKPGLTRGNVVTRLRCFERNMVWDLYGRVWMGEYHVSTALTRPPPPAFSSSAHSAGYCIARIPADRMLHSIVVSNTRPTPPLTLSSGCAFRCCIAWVPRGGRSPAPNRRVQYLPDPSSHPPTHQVARSAAALHGSRSTALNNGSVHFCLPLLSSTHPCIR